MPNVYLNEKDRKALNEAEYQLSFVLDNFVDKESEWYSNYIEAMRKISTATDSRKIKRMAMKLIEQGKA